MLATDLQRVSALAEPAPPHQPARGAQPAAASGGTAHSRPFPPIGVALYSVLTERCEGKTKDHKAFAHERVGRRPPWLSSRDDSSYPRPARSEVDPTTGWPMVSSDVLRLELYRTSAPPRLRHNRISLFMQLLLQSRSKPGRNASCPRGSVRILSAQAHGPSRPRPRDDHTLCSFCDERWRVAAVAFLLAVGTLLVEVAAGRRSVLSQ